MGFFVCGMMVRFGYEKHFGKRWNRVFSSYIGHIWFIMIEFFKKHGFVIAVYPFAFGVLLDYLSVSKWLIIILYLISLLGGIGMVTAGLTKK